jgi:hypothetical protein
MLLLLLQELQGAVEAATSTGLSGNIHGLD